MNDLYRSYYISHEPGGRATWLGWQWGVWDPAHVNGASPLSIVSPCRTLCASSPVDSHSDLSLVAHDGVSPRPPPPATLSEGFNRGASSMTLRIHDSYSYMNGLQPFMQQMASSSNVTETLQEIMGLFMPRVANCVARIFGVTATLMSFSQGVLLHEVGDVAFTHSHIMASLSQAESNAEMIAGVSCLRTGSMKRFRKLALKTGGLLFGWQQEIHPSTRN